VVVSGDDVLINRENLILGPPHPEQGRAPVTGR
jgi:hypothetical protein